MLFILATFSGFCGYREGEINTVLLFRFVAGFVFVVLEGEIDTVLW